MAASAEELDLKIIEAHGILECAQALHFPDVDQAAIRAAIAAAEAPLAAGDENAQGIERGQKIDALTNVIQDILIKPDNLRSIRDGAAELQGLVNAVAASIRASQDALDDAGAAPAATLEAIRIQRARLADQHRDIPGRLEQLTILPRSVLGMDLGVEPARTNAAAALDQIQVERARLATVAEGFVVELENAIPELEERIRVSAISLEVTRNVAIRERIDIINDQRAKLQDQIAAIRAAKRSAQLVTSAHAEDIVARQNAAVAEADAIISKLTITLQITELNRTIAVAEQALHAARDAIAAVADPRGIEAVVNAQRFILIQQARQINEARDRIHGPIPAELAGVQNTADLAANETLAQIDAAQALAQQQIDAAEAIVQLQAESDEALRATAVARNAMRDAGNPEELGRAAEHFLGVDALQAPGLADIALNLGLNPNLVQQVNRAAVAAREQIDAVREELEKAREAAAAVARLNTDGHRGRRDFAAYAEQLILDSEGFDARGISDTEKLVRIRTHLNLIREEYARIRSWRDELNKLKPFAFVQALRETESNIERELNALKDRSNDLHRQRADIANRLIGVVENKIAEATRDMQQLSEWLDAARQDPARVKDIQDRIQTRIAELDEAIRVVSNVNADENAPEIIERKDTAIRKAEAVREKLDRVLAILPYSHDAAVAQQAAVAAGDAIDFAPGVEARIHAINAHQPGLAAQLGVLDNALNELEAIAPIIAVGTVENLIKQEIAAVKEARTVVQAAQERGANEILAAELNIAIDEARQTRIAVERAFRGEVNAGVAPQQIIDCIDEQHQLLNQAKQQLNDAVADARNIPNGVADIENIRSNAAEQIRVLEEQYAGLEEKKSEAENNLGNVAALEEAVEKGNATFQQARRIIPEELNDSNRTPIEKITTIKQQQALLSEQIKEIRSALTKVNGVAGIDLIRNAAEDKIEEIQNGIEYLEGQKQEQLKFAIVEIKQRARDNRAAVVQLSQQLIMANDELVRAILLDEPETKVDRLKEKIKVLETQLSEISQAADIKQYAQTVNIEISEASEAIRDALATEQSYLQALPLEIDAVNKASSIMVQMTYHQEKTAYMRQFINTKGDRIETLQRMSNLSESQKQELAKETYLLQSAMDELRKSEQALERLEAERIAVMDEAERVLSEREAVLNKAVEDAHTAGRAEDENLYSDELAEIQAILAQGERFNRGVWSHTVLVRAMIPGRGNNPANSNTNIYQVDRSIDALKANNKALYDRFAGYLVYGNAQRAAVEPVALPDDKPLTHNTHFAPIQAIQKQRAESALKEATGAVAAFKGNEKKVRPLIWALMGARIRGDQKEEAEALRWFYDTENRQKLYREANAAIETLNERMVSLGDAASPQLQAEAKLLKHQWSMTRREMRAIDMSNEIDFYAKRLQTALKQIEEEIAELNALKDEKTRSPSPEIEAKIVQAQDRLKDLSAEAQFNAQMVVDLQSKRKKLKEEIRLESEKIEQDLSALYAEALDKAFRNGASSEEQRAIKTEGEQKFGEAKSHTAVAQTALDDVLKQDDQINALVNRWNGLREAHGQDVLPTSAEDLSREGKTLAERKAWAQWELFSLLEFRIEDIAKDPKLFDRYKKAMAVLHPSTGIEQNEEQIKALIGKSIEEYIKELKEEFKDNRPWTEQIKERIEKSVNGDSEPDANKLMESGCQAQLDCWRDGNPRKFKQNEPKKYNAWKEALLKRQVETIAGNRSEGMVAVVGIGNSNDHTMSFYATEWDATNEKYVSQGSLLTYVKAQMTLLKETTDPAEKKLILDDVETAIKSAKRDPRFAISPAAAQVAEAVLSGLDAAHIASPMGDDLRAEVATIRQKDPRVAAEDSSITADVPFEAVRRRMIADIILANPAAPPAEQAAARQVKDVYDKKNGVFKDQADLDAAKVLEDRGFKPGDAISTTIKNDKGEDESVKYKVSEKDSVIHLEMQKSNSRNPMAPPKTVAEIDIKGVDTGKTTASISAEPEVGANAAAIAAERIAAPIPGGGNKSVTFKLKNYDRGWMDIRGKKGAEREAKYVKEILAKGIIPVFETHEAKHHDSAVWATFKDLAVAAKKISDNSARDLYLETVFKTENAQLKKELISGMFMKTGELVDGQLRICEYDDTKRVTTNALGLNEDMMRPRKSYTQAEFEALDEDKQKEMILQQAIKPQGVLENDKKFIHKEKLASGKIGEDKETEEFELSVGEDSEEESGKGVEPVEERIHKEGGDRRHYMGFKTK